MGFCSAKAKLKAINNNNTNTTGSGSNSSSENWGMGLLLVFFPEDNSSTNNNNNHPTINVDRNHLLSSPNSSSPSSSSSSSSSLKFKSLRRNGSNFILSRAQSTISICALFLFITLLLFTLSTFEPSITPHTPSSPRRFLSHKPISKTSSFAKISHPRAIKTPLLQLSPTALQGMGALYRRGTRAMNDLVVGHVLEDVTDNDLHLFLRLLHRSSLTAKADLVLIFPNSTSLSTFGPIFQEENDSFFKLVHHYDNDLNTTASQKRVLGFDVTQFMKPGKKEMGESMWGKRVQKSNSSINSDGSGEEIETEATRLSYGSVVGFESSELDPENSLAGFLDHVPMSLRRWACYPMLLGRVRRNFKHVMLVDVKNSILLRDPLGRVRNRNPGSVYLSTKAESSSKHNKNSDKTQSHFLVNSAVIMGGARGVRRLSNSMLTEIVRAAMQHKKKNSVTESAILSQLVASEFLLKNVNLVTNTESIPETSSLIPGLNSASATSLSDYAIIQRGNGNYDFNSLIMKLICSFEEDSSVYRDC